MSMVIATKERRHIALIARQTDQYIEVIRLTPHGLTTTRLTEEQLVSDWGKLTKYDAAEGVRRFTAIAADKGATVAARRLLDRLRKEYLD